MTSKNILYLAYFGIGFLVVCGLMYFLVHSTSSIAYGTQKPKKLRVAILPICNLGFTCPAKLINKLDHAFFSHPKGVAKFISEASNNKINLTGKVLPWLTPKRKINNYKEVIKYRNELINLAHDKISLAKFDVFYLYIRVKGPGTQVGWKLGQKISTPTGQISPGIAFMVNSYIAPKPNEFFSQSSIVPSVSWAHELLHVLGLSGHANSFACSENKLDTCKLRAYGDPFSVMGEAAFSLYPNQSMKRALGWSKKQDITQIIQDGRYIFDLNNPKSPKALQINLPKALKLRPGVEFNKLFIEPLYAKNFNNILNRLDGGKFLARYSQKNNFPKTGALLYLGYSKLNTNTTVLLDTNLNSSGVKKRGIKWPYNTGEMADAPLTPNNIFFLFDTGINILLEQISSTKILVKISGLKTNLTNTY